MKNLTMKLNIKVCFTIAITLLFTSLFAAFSWSEKAQAETQTIEITEDTTGAKTGIFVTSDYSLSGITCIQTDLGYWEFNVAPGGPIILSGTPKQWSKFNIYGGYTTLSNFHLSSTNSSILCAFASDLEHLSALPGEVIDVSEIDDYYAGWGYTVFEGDWTLEAKSIKASHLVINGTTVNVSSGNAELPAAVTVSDSLNLQSGKLSAVNTLNPQGGNIGVGLQVGGATTIGEGADLFASGTVAAYYGANSLGLTDFSKWSGSSSFLLLSDRNNATSQVEEYLDSSLGKYSFKIANANETVAKTIQNRLPEIPPAPVPVPDPTEAAQTGDSVISLIVFGIVALVSGAGFAMSRRFRKN